MEKTEEKEKTLEESFQELETILVKLEDKDIPLEESFQKYQEGMQLLKSCKDKIDLVEKKILMLNEEGQLEEF
ncbi:MAG TPA: exodeoxyribonuclease VII small subunit [Candidatus Choladousia intestinavium]|uniref:Exodeoxyribonuclease 7 small subunit n=1 Tax=Candidatus Choladousia intestinavium TaxID=2840727 RepID=A0A9D1D8A6_9FIRM|nr:exodeoxyribonuclease VII small subunit [Candidatus Choladousia intestinavium]